VISRSAWCRSPSPSALARQRQRPARGQLRAGRWRGSYGDRCSESGRRAELSVIRANGWPSGDDRLREAIQKATQRRLDCFVATLAMTEATHAGQNITTAAFEAGVLSTLA